MTNAEEQPIEVESFKCVTFEAYDDLSEALRIAADWIKNNAGEIWNWKLGDPPIFIVSDISCHYYESWWTVHVYCKEYDGE